MTSNMAHDWDKRATTKAEAMRYIIDGYAGPEAEFYQSGLKHWDDMRVAMRHFGVWPPPERRVSAVEVGCGVGRMTVHMAQDFTRLYAFDVSAEMLRHAPAIENARYVAGDSLDVIPAAVDYVLSFLVFQHMPKMAFWRYLEEAADLLERGGVLCTQMHMGYGDWPDTETLRVRGYQREDFAVLDSAVWERVAVLETAPGTSEPWYWLVLRRK